MVGLSEEVKGNSSSNDGKEVGNLSRTSPDERKLQIVEVRAGADSGSGMENVRHVYELVYITKTPKRGRSADTNKTGAHQGLNNRWAKKLLNFFLVFQTKIPNMVHNTEICS